MTGGECEHNRLGLRCLVVAVVEGEGITLGSQVLPNLLHASRRIFRPETIVQGATAPRPSTWVGSTLVYLIQAYCIKGGQEEGRKRKATSFQSSLRRERLMLTG